MCADDTNITVSGKTSKDLEINYELDQKFLFG